MKHCIVLLLAITSLTATRAQEQDGFYLPMGFTYAFETVKDNSLSPVSYSGHLGGLHLGFYFQNENWLSELNLGAAGAYQYPDVERDISLSQTLSIISRGAYSLSYQVFEKDEWRFFAGLLSLNSFDYRNHNRYGNSQDNYAAFLSAGPALTTQRGFGLWDQDFLFQYQLGIPVGTYYFRPSYIRPYFNDAPGSKGFAWWGDYFEISSRADLAWILKNENQLRLSYNWGYSQLDKLNKVQLATHYLALTSVFKF